MKTCGVEVAITVGGYFPAPPFSVCDREAGHLGAHQGPLRLGWNESAVEAPTTEQPAKGER